MTIEIVDTPGFFDTEFTDGEIKEELIKALTLSAPGLNAILFVIQMGRFTAEMQKLVDVFFEFFGEDVHKFAIPLFSFANSQSALKEFLGFDETYDSNDEDDCCAELGLKHQIRKENMNQKLYELIMKCGGNIMIIDNSARGDTKVKQVQAIFDEIKRIKQSTNNGLFRNAAYRKVDQMMIKYGQEGQNTSSNQPVNITLNVNQQCTSTVDNLGRDITPEVRNKFKHECQTNRSFLKSVVEGMGEAICAAGSVVASGFKKLFSW